MHFSPKLARIIRRLLLGIAFVATFVLLAVLTVNWIGDRAWERVVAQEAARGRHLAQLPPVGTLQPEHNLMCAPIVQRLLFRERKGESISVLSRSIGFFQERFGRWTEGRPFDADTLLQAVREHGFSPPQAMGAEDALLAAFKDDLCLVSEIRSEALARGDAQLVRPEGLREQRIFETQIISFNADRLLTPLLKIEACIALRQGRHQEAFEDALTLLRLVRGHGGSRQVFVVEAMVQAMLVREALAVVWEASRSKAWSASQWDMIEGELKEIRLLDTLADALWMETLCVNQVIDSSGLRSSEVPGTKVLGLRLAERSLMCRGVRQQNKVISVEIIRRWLEALEATGTSQYLSRRAEAEREQERALTGFRYNPNTWFVRLSTPSYDRLLDSLVIWQSYVALGRIACLLERHRLAFDRYPESLESLGAGGQGRIPRDPANGEVPRYRLRADGHYELYMVGLDGHDDDGRQTANLGYNGGPGDLTWPLVHKEVSR